MSKHQGRKTESVLIATEFVLIALSEKALNRENHFQVNKTLATIQASQMHSFT